VDGLWNPVDFEDINPEDSVLIGGSLHRIEYSVSDAKSSLGSITLLLGNFLIYSSDVLIHRAPHIRSLRWFHESPLKLLKTLEVLCI
jgi:hypothetical protein